jgi:transcription initiation factor IIE alpha subunit
MTWHPNTQEINETFERGLTAIIDTLRKKLANLQDNEMLLWALAL